MHQGVWKISKREVAARHFAYLTPKHQRRIPQRILPKTLLEERRILLRSREILEPCSQKPSLRNLPRVAIEMVLGDRSVPGVRTVPEVPRQHLLLASLDEILRCIRDREERELPLVVEPAGAEFAAEDVLVAVAREGVFGVYGAFYEGAVLGGEGDGLAVAFVVGDEVGAGDVEEGEDAEEVVGCCGACGRSRSKHGFLR